MAKHYDIQSMLTRASLRYVHNENLTRTVEKLDHFRNESNLFYKLKQPSFSREWFLVLRMVTKRPFKERP